jgi:hypothetical protein
MQMMAEMPTATKMRKKTRTRRMMRKPMRMRMTTKKMLSL